MAQTGYLALRQNATRGTIATSQLKLAAPSRASFSGRHCILYGEEYDGKTTASGERFDMHHFTAAHPTLKFGTHVRVTNLQNGRALIVRVNDRGPLVHGRIIDLSYIAARILNFRRQGVQRGRLDFQE